MKTLPKIKPKKTQNWNADKYHIHSSIQFEASKKILKQITLNGDESILDIGCGDGKITAMISALIPKGQILGIDLSSKMIEFAKSKFTETQYPNISFENQNAIDIAFENEFELIFSSFALHWVIDFNSFIKKVNRALSNNGKIVFTIPLGISDPLEQATEELMKNPSWDEYFLENDSPWRFSDATEYKEMILKAGFEILSLEVIPDKKVFESRNDLENYIIQWYPYTNFIAKDKRNKFFMEIIDRYLEIEPYLDSGKINFEYPRIDIIAQKK